MGTVFPVDVVGFLQNRRAQLCEGLATHPRWVSWCRSEHRVSPSVCECAEEQDAGFGGRGALAAVGTLLWCSREGSGSSSVRKYCSHSAVHGRMLRSLGVSFVGSKLCPGGMFL